LTRVALDTLRKGAGRLFGMILMGMLVFSFGIWGIADIFRGYGQQSLIRVGDIDITTQEYLTAQHDALRAMSNEAKRSLSLQEAREAGLESRVLERLIGGAAVDSHADALKLDISNTALLDEIKQDPNLKDPSGNFNPITFQQLLRTLGLSEQGFLAEQRERNLRRQIIGTVGKTVVTPQVLLTALAQFNGETRSLRYVVVPKTAGGTLPEPTDDELKRFYDNHPAKFTQAETRKLGVIAVTPESVKDQVQIVEDEIKAAYEVTKDKLGQPERRHVQQISFPDKAAADAAYQKIQSGADFAAIAKDQGVSEADIDLGTVKHDELADPAIAGAAFALEANKVSEPIAGKLGTVLLRVTEIQPGKVPTYDEAKADIEKRILKDRAEDVILDIRDRVEDERASGAKLSEVADKLKLSYQVIDQVDRSGKAADGADVTLPDKPDLLTAAFNTDVGVENDPLDSKEGGFVWYDVEGVNPQQLKPFDQVKDAVATDWREDAERNRLAKYTDGLEQSLKDGKSLEDLAKELNTEVLPTEPLKRDGLTANVLPAAVAQAFALPQGGYGSALTGLDGARIVFQVDKIAPPAPLDAPTTDQLKRQMNTFISDDMLAEYFSALEDRYGVTVNKAALAKLAGGEQQ
jgi:peptidyl-prolyl cis-trans isomerase D